MKILQIFNRYRFRGGEEAWVDGIPSLMGNSASVDELRFHTEDWLKEDRPSPLRQIVLMGDNPDSRAQLKKRVRDFKPDVLLFHNVIPVGSFGLYHEAKKLGVPILQYTHNFRPFSPGGTLWTGREVNDAGMRGNFWPEIRHGAWQGSPIKTAILALHLKRAIANGLLESIDRWIAPSRFMRDKFIEAGVPAERVKLLLHCWEAGPAQENTIENGHYLFLGRLVAEKGVKNLVDAWKILEVELGDACPNLVIGGTGPEEDALREACKGLKRVTCAGFLEGSSKEKLLKTCRALLVPSIWWEPLGLTAYEAYAQGRPVIAAKSGALQETVRDGVTGWTHRAGMPDDLAKVIIQAEQAGSAERARRGALGREWLCEHGSPQKWQSEFLKICTQVIAEKSTRQHPVQPHPAPAAAARGSGSEVDSHRSPENAKLPSPAARPSPLAPPRPSPPADADCPSGRKALAAPASQTPLRLATYLADQNPGYDRSFGISRMSQVVLMALDERSDVALETTSSKTSQRLPDGTGKQRILPWGTRNKWLRLLTDHFHPLFRSHAGDPDVHYFPKGYLPLLSVYCHPSVVTIHDAIIQYHEDHYPKWRNSWEYAYWALMLKHTLKHADRLMTVSESSKLQICNFMTRHHIAPKPITVTYEPCQYEAIEQPIAPNKENYVIHLASREPHKRSAHLIRWWHEAEAQGRNLPTLHLVGSVPPEVAPLLASSYSIVRRPFLEEAALEAVYLEARALILPSEIEGFGLPALEAYYLGTPVCFVKGTSVEEVLSVATQRGAFTLDDPNSLFKALDEVMAMTPEEVRQCGLCLRETYAAHTVADRMIEVFRECQALDDAHGSTPRPN